MSTPNILILDIETAPITAYTWGLFDQNIGLNQIKADWHLLSWAAKWLGEAPSKTIYMDNSKAKDITDDKALVAGLAALLNKADIIITQNGDEFDIKKLNARAVINGLPPIKPCRSTDLLKESRKVFKFTSHKLEYMTGKLNKKYKKLSHKKHPGFELWSAILAGDKSAWK
jgi:DNA polymerase elongation subunit (family B)